MRKIDFTKLRRALSVLVCGGMVLAVWLAAPSLPAQNDGNGAPASSRQTVSAEPYDCSQGIGMDPTADVANLEDPAQAWGVYCEGAPTWRVANVASPSLDGSAFLCALTGGAPNSNVHCYRNLLADPAAQHFELRMDWRFTPVTVCNNAGKPSALRALEFTFNKWQDGMRYEFALQWNNVGDRAPGWRYWNPHRADRWVPLAAPATQCLKARVWHTLRLWGHIADGRVRYDYFRIDGVRYPLNITVRPWKSPGDADRLAVAVQIDGNDTPTPVNLVIDRVTFTRLP